MNTDHEVLIAGAGPAGALAARILARQGHRVALFDKAVFPREKVCGDCLNPAIGDIWERHGLSGGFRALPRAKAAGVTLEKEGRMVFRQNNPEDGPAHWVVSRSILDDWLVREAREAGAVFYPGVEVQSADAEGILETSMGSFRGALIIGADGRNSRVARSAGLAQTGGRCERVAWQADIPSVGRDSDVHLNVFREGYYGIARGADGSDHLCMVLEKGSPAQATSVARRYFPGLPEVEWRTVAPLARPHALAGRGRVWLAGDAARVVEPLTGEGIYLALASGEIAAENAHRLLEDENPRAALSRYGREISALHKRRARVNNLARWCLSKPRRALAVFTVFGRMPRLARMLVNAVQTAGHLPVSA